MGTEARIIVCGGPDHLTEQARSRIVALESRWSRFDPSSEISGLNRQSLHGPSHERGTIVSTDTYRLVETAVAAWHRTAGRYDPTVLAALQANGYDRTFDAIEPFVSVTAGGGGAPGCGRIILDPGRRAIVLPRGVGIDPGGIGKGLAADLVANELLVGGAVGALVDIGGDIRVVGHGPHDGKWIVDVADPYNEHDPVLHLALTDGAVASSSTRRRRWATTDGERHHLIDPVTGRPLTTPLVAATVIASHAWWAEALTKAILVAGDLTPVADASAIAFDMCGKRTCTHDLAVLAP